MRKNIVFQNHIVNDIRDIVNIKSYQYQRYLGICKSYILLQIIKERYFYKSQTTFS